MRENLHGTVDLGQIAVGNIFRSLVADTKLETSGTPVDKLDGALGLERGDSSVGVVRHDVTSVQQAGGHIFAETRVAFDHLIVGFKAGHGNLLDRVGFVGSLGSRDDGGVGDKREMNSRVRHQVGLELVQINVQGTIESKRGSDGGDD